MGPYFRYQIEQHMKSLLLLAVCFSSTIEAALSCYSCQGSTLDQVLNGCPLTECKSGALGCFSTKFVSNGDVVYARDCYETSISDEFIGCNCIGDQQYLCLATCRDTECDSIGDGFDELTCDEHQPITNTTTTATTTVNPITSTPTSASLQPVATIVSILCLLVAWQ